MATPKGWPSAFFNHHNMGFVYHPLFREGVILAAIILLAVFCIDKSRQNQRTRNALYNCIYVLYGAATAKVVQLFAIIFPQTLWRECLAMAIVVVATWGYGRLLKPQHDIPWNGLFRTIGWVVMVVLLVVQAMVLFKVVA
jgi:hypothetical protein